MHSTASDNVTISLQQTVLGESPIPVNICPDAPWIVGSVVRWRNVLRRLEVRPHVPASGVKGLIKAYETIRFHK